MRQRHSSLCSRVSLVETRIRNFKTSDSYLQNNMNVIDPMNLLLSQPYALNEIIRNFLISKSFEYHESVNTYLQYKQILAFWDAHQDHMAFIDYNLAPLSYLKRSFGQQIFVVSTIFFSLFYRFFDHLLWEINLGQEFFSLLLFLPLKKLFLRFFILLLIIVTMTIVIKVPLQLNVFIGTQDESSPEERSRRIWMQNKVLLPYRQSSSSTVKPA